MRRLCVVVALMLAVGVWSTTAAGSQPAGAAAVGSLEADFNNDGFIDLAVGVAQEGIGSLQSVGAVNVLYGSAAGLTGSGSQQFTQDSAGVPGTAEANDRFGDALAAGDFDNDGAADLAVGMLAESVASSQGAGAVNILYGTAAGLTGSGSQQFTQDSTGVPGTADANDHFGAVLAAGDLDRDGFADLAVGVPGESLGSIAAAGAINLLYGTAAGLTGSGSQQFTQDSAGVPGTAEPDDSFGGALAAGDLDNDGFADLAVGAAGEDLGSINAAGAVNVLYGTAAGLTGSSSQQFTQDSAAVPGAAAPSDFFGGSLATGDLDDDGFADLAVGVQGEDVGTIEIAGGVNILYGATAGLTGSGSQLFTQASPGVPDVAELADRFGDRLATGDFDNDGFVDLAVGVPTESVGSIIAAGAVNTLYGAAAGLTSSGSQFFTQDSPGVPGVAEEVDIFGTELV